MDSNRIKNLAVGVRDALRAEVSSRLDAMLAEGSRERLEAPQQVGAIETDIKEHGRDEVVDRAAYTWFNRLCALRFMDANGYTPVPVVTPRPGQTQPAILADAAQGSFDPEWGIPDAGRQRVAGLLLGTVPSANPSEDAYAELLRAVCARYARPMGYLFAEDVASSLLMPQGLLAQGSILSRIVEVLDGETCSSVEVLGWLYQFYISERKDEYFRSGKKATAEDIPAATQLFTPEWIVRFLAENSLGRLWMLNNPGSGLAESMDYYVAPEGDEPHIEVTSADEIRVLDPACGSGHILVYAFDLLYAMYEEEGWLPEDIPAMILRNNLFGLEIDRRAAEIASFALEMKARERDPRFFEREIDANVHVLVPVSLDSHEQQLVPKLAARCELLDAMAHLDEVGSLYVPDNLDESVLESELAHVERDGSLFAESVIAKLKVMLANMKALGRSFHCVIANPPYMGSGNMNQWMNGWVKNHYPDEKSDLCTCFIERSFKFAKEDGYASLITMQSWMFLGSYEGMRQKIITGVGIISMAHLGAHAFDSIGGEVVQTTATVFVKRPNTNGLFFRLIDEVGGENKSHAIRDAIHSEYHPLKYRASSDRFRAIPGTPIAYNASDALVNAFLRGVPLSSIASPKTGLVTGNNDLFLRLWWEVGHNDIGFGCTDSEDAFTTNKLWFPCQKGGAYRRWYGNNDYLVDWYHDGQHLRNSGLSGTSIRNTQYYFAEGMTWSVTGAHSLAMRYCPKGFVFETKGSKCFADTHSNLLTLLALVNTSVANHLLQVYSPTMDFGQVTIGKMPVLDSSTSSNRIHEVVNECVSLSQEEWDSFEASWDFTWHPLVPSRREWEAQHNASINTDKRALSVERIDARYELWESDCRYRFDSLKVNEEELNCIFARIYNMEGEVPIEVPDDKVSVRLADRARDARSLISYGVGCMLGRYSTEKEGLILADQGATSEDFRAKVPGASFLPDEDNILPVLTDEWFEDDIVAGFRAWLAHAFGAETVDENVAWLEESIGKDLRSYFCKDFYADHLKIYQKRPIYWMFQSPKKSFQCLVYMHRYGKGTVGTILTGYLRPLEDKLKARLSVLDAPGASAVDVREADKVRAQISELEQWERDVIYPLAHEMVSIDLDDGVKVNYNRFPKALAKVTGLSEWR